MRQAHDMLRDAQSRVQGLFAQACEYVESLQGVSKKNSSFQHQLRSGVKKDSFPQIPLTNNLPGQRSLSALRKSESAINLVPEFRSKNFSPPSDRPKLWANLGTPVNKYGSDHIGWIAQSNIC